MAVITLTTDFGTQDAYIGMLKGAIYAIAPTATVIDLTHAVAPQNVRQGSYILRTAVPFFPPDTIHIAVVDPGVGTTRRPILLHTAQSGYLVGPDNGLFEYVLRREGREVRLWVLDKPAYWRAGVSATFHGRDIFAPIAAHLAGGIAPDTLGTPARFDSRVRLDDTLPQTPALHTFLSTRPKERVIGRVAHIDHFGNILTDIEATVLAEVRADDRPRLHIDILCVDAETTRVVTAIGLRTTYADVAARTLTALVSSSGFVEVAVNGGNAAQQYAVPLGAVVAISLP